MNKDQLIKYFDVLKHENKISHAYLIETNNITEAINVIRDVIKLINCKDSYVSKCNKCSVCHLLETNSLPSYIEISPDGKNIKKDSIEYLQKRFANKPIYTENNIYTIIYPEKMNSSAFNKLLKFIEEPEDGIIGFLITENKDYVAKTIVSRCEILKYINYENLPDISDINYQLALDIIKQIESNNSNLIWYFNNELKFNNISRENVINIFNFIFKIYFDAFHGKIIDNISFSNLSLKLKVIKKYLEQLNYNVNIGLLIDSFTSEIGEVL